MKNIILKPHPNVEPIATFCVKNMLISSEWGSIETEIVSFAVFLASKTSTDFVFDASVFGAILFFSGRVGEGGTLGKKVLLIF